LEKINKEIALLEKKIFIRENSNAGVTVYAVLSMVSYEGSEVIGLYTNKSDAEAHINWIKEIANYPTSSEFSIAEFKLSSRFDSSSFGKTPNGFYDEIRAFHYDAY
jgi:hypothetical protein